MGTSSEQRAVCFMGCHARMHLGNQSCGVSVGLWYFNGAWLVAEAPQNYQGITRKAPKAPPPKLQNSLGLNHQEPTDGPPTSPTTHHLGTTVPTMRQTHHQATTHPPLAPDAPATHHRHKQATANPPVAPDPHRWPTLRPQRARTAPLQPRAAYASRCDAAHADARPVTLEGTFARLEVVIRFQVRRCGRWLLSVWRRSPARAQGAHLAAARGRSCCGARLLLR